MVDNMATNFATASYTEVIDLQTVNGHTSVIGLHTPVGRGPYARLKGFFQQFKKFKYNGITSLVMVPAANLPVDPLGLTGQVGTTDLMDPRDMLNPILFHGCHGENLNEILNTIYGANSYVSESAPNPNVNNLGDVSDSAEKYDIVNTASDTLNYYRCLTDKSWKKFGIQSGVKLHGLRPLVWKVAQNHPLVPTFTHPNAGELVSTGSSQDSPYELANINPGNIADTNAYKHYMEQQAVNVWNDTANPRYVYNQQFTNGVTGLGWLPTAQMDSSKHGVLTDSYASIQTCLPRLYMGVIVMPPAYNVEQFYRCVISHSFSFRDFTSSTDLMGVGVSEVSDTAYTLFTNYFNWIDYSESSTAKSSASVPFSHGETVDVIGGTSSVISDGVR